MWQQNTSLEISFRFEEEQGKEQEDDSVEYRQGSDRAQCAPRV